jgi:hypothetical protein
MFAAAFSPAMHQDKQLESDITEHFENHEAKHHSLDELTQLSLTENDTSDNHEHPSCEQSNHQNHCHHTSLVYIELQQNSLLPFLVNNQKQCYLFSLSSRVSSPDFRPPIV